ncbi:MAG TPA: AraC family transcriptional regulator [Methylocystis sp.]|nr:AraC family transcriptional regulator [Methylocystis sp.]
MKELNSSGTIKVRSFQAVAEVAGELGADVEQALKDAALDPDLFSRRDDVIGYPSLGRLLDECIKATGCEDFGLRVGMREAAGAIGLAGFAAINAPTVREALQTLVGSLHLSDAGGVARLEAQNGVATFSWRVTTAGVERSEQIADAAAAIGCNLMRRLCGPKWNPIEACLTRPRPSDIRLFTAFFRAPIRFEAEEVALVFQSGQLDQEVEGRDRDLHEVLAPLLERAMAEARRGFQEDVANVLRAQVSNGPLSPARAASALGLSARSLSRRLAEEGASFLDLAQRVKYDMAQSLLRQDKAIAEVAMLLGYSDPTAFSRAFKLWSGTTPASWREEQRRRLARH